MTEIDDRFGALAQRLVTKYGKVVTFTITEPGAFDPVTGMTSGSTTTDTEVKVTPPRAVRVADVDGTLVKAGDMIVSCAALDYVPSIGETVAIDDVAYSVVAVAPVYSGEMVAKYDCRIRK